MLYEAVPNSSNSHRYSHNREVHPHSANIGWVLRAKEYWFSTHKWILYAAKWHIIYWWEILVFAHVVLFLPNRRGPISFPIRYSAHTMGFEQSFICRCYQNDVTICWNLSQESVKKNCKNEPKMNCNKIKSKSKIDGTWLEQLNRRTVLVRSERLKWKENVSTNMIFTPKTLFDEQKCHGAPLFIVYRHKNPKNGGCWGI